MIVWDSNAGNEGGCMEEEQEEQRVVRECIEQFLQERCAEKLKKAKDEGEQEEILARHERETWLADAVRRSTWIKLITHALKYIHPDAKGTSLYCREEGMPPEGLVCTASCGNICEDVVGNAAALDVYKLLKLEVGGKSLLQRVGEDDSALRAAFSDDVELASSWMAGLRELRSSEDRPASHTLAKQVYFPLENGEYHLLAPLFPTSLVQRVYTVLREDRFGEAAKEAREARKNGAYCEHGYSDYPDLLVQKYGGTKPQNISQLNSERHGENWLLSSCPPTWRMERIRLPLGVESVFGHVLNWRREIRQRRDILVKFLEKMAHTSYTNVAIRDARAEMLDDILGAILQWVAIIQEQEEGWTADPKCRLHPVEQFWLDPGRGTLDLEWGKQREAGQWREELIQRFARWLNVWLTTKKLRMSDDEHREWKKQITEALRAFEREVTQ